MEPQPYPRSSSPEPELSEQKSLEDSFDVLVSKHLIPPPLMLLPKPVSHKPKSLTPMIPLPAFVGIIPNFQPLDKPINMLLCDRDYDFSWIGDAFDRVVYRKYEEESYKKIDNVDQNWNIWACDLNKMSGRKSAEDNGANQPQINPYYTPKNYQDKTLIFESRFESGNLSMASKVSDNEYNLLLQNDINTNGYSQWFFFKVTNAQKGQKYRFNILNQYKMNNLYKMGMKIIVYSKRESQERNVSWHRGGQNIKYYENGYSKSSTDYKPYFTLSWDYTFVYQDDDLYFAYSYPFTYSNLEAMTFKIESDVHLRNICQRAPLCKTVAGNRVDVLTITEQHPYQQLDKAYVIITARIHPGQSVSSYVCNGIIQFLISSDEKARKLRQHFIFKVVPMLNPDGVIHGNYRSNISGYDLNRKWSNPSKIYHPQIFHLKKMIMSIQQIGQVVLFCDLHGHSMKKNAFIYGCHDSNNLRNGKQLPLLLSKLFKAFSFKDCSFLDIEEEEGTSRTVLSKELRHCDIYALQSSFCGPQHDNIHFTVRHFEELGQKFCQSLLIHFKDRMKQMTIQAAMKQKSYFPNQDSSFESMPEYEELKNVDDLIFTEFEDRVNSQYSQLSQEEEESKVVLQDRVIKKYLMMKFLRPGTTSLSRSNVLIRRKSHSKQPQRIKLGDFLNTKSTSPIKRRELYETPAASKYEKPKQTTKLSSDRKELQPKLFQPIDIVPMGQKKRHQSVGKIIYEAEKIVKTPERASVKVVINKNREVKEQKGEEPFFKNNYLKSVGKQQIKSQKKMNEFLIRKRVPYSDQKNSVNLFNSVLSSLRKDRK